VDMTVMSPYTAAEKYRNGQLPDSASSKETACSINGYPDGLMLSHIHVMKPRAKVSKIFCGILTTERDHKTNAPAVIETWGKRCDGYLAFSTVDDEEISAVKVYHEDLAMSGERQNNWQMVRSLWKYMHAHFVEDFDFFFLGRDDTFVIVENLRYYLTSPGIQERFNDHAGLYLGRRFKAEGYEELNPGEFDGYYNHKGPGYVLDKHALKVSSQLTAHRPDPIVLYYVVLI
jgi:Fringe-like